MKNFVILSTVIIFFSAVSLLLIASRMKKKLVDNYIESLKLDRINAFNELSSQVSHDIRSPLAALNMIVGSLDVLPEEKRQIIRNATQRINDIANQLLQKGKDPVSEASKKSGPSPLAEPTMLVWGQLDTVFTRADMERIREAFVTDWWTEPSPHRLPKTPPPLEEIPDAGHCSFQEQPVIFNGLVEKFLAAHAFAPNRAAPPA